jgi:putative membrane protein
MLMKRLTAAAAAAIAFTCVCALAQSAIPQMKTSAADGEKAAATYFTQDSIGDVQLGKLGLEKSKNAGVRNLAAAMVRDHTMTAQAGLRVAKAIGDSDLKWQPGDDNQMVLTRLSRYSGSQFDREYVKALVQAHETDINTAEEALEFTSTPAVKNYLQQTMSVDRKHLRMAQALQSRV